MSIKSQKSLNEECNEIFERSYSIKSASEESISSDEGEEYMASEIMRKLTPAVLSRLRQCFKRAREKKSRDLDKKVEEVMRAAAAEEGIEFAVTAPSDAENLYLNETGFVSALDNILGNPRYKSHARTLYRALDRFQTGRVSWSQLVARLVASGAKATASRIDTWKPVQDVGVTKLAHCQRETLVTLVSVEKDDSFCYVAVSRGGRVGVYSGEMNLLKSYEVFYHRTGVKNRVRNSWITDAVYMNDVSCLALSASDRSLTIYDVTSLTHTPLYCITGLPNIPTCLAYCSSPSGYSELLMGTERGELTRLRFLQPRVSLLHVKVPDTINYYFWMELTCPPHTTYCSTHTCRAAHSRTVRRVAYIEDDLVLSCSHDTVLSLRMKYLTGKLEDYEIGVHRGVSCFHSVPRLRLLATGSKDGRVRLWTLAQRTPLARLAAPRTALARVLDVMILDADNIVLGYFSHFVVHIWDLYEECLLQTVKLKFPFVGVLGKKIEFGTACLHLGPPRRKAPMGSPEFVGRSRRGSSVYEGSTGGLILQLEPDTSELTDCAPRDRCEVLLSCNDSICTLRLRESEADVVRAASRAAQGRRPSVWDQLRLDNELPATRVRLSTPRSKTSASPVETDTLLLQPHIHTTYDLDQLIANAGLDDILKKNFVLMRGLKHDLNKRLFEMESDGENRKLALNMCAPYLSLPRYDLAPLPSLHRLAERHESVKRYFPGPSVNVTPSGSQAATPRTLHKMAAR